MTFDPTRHRQELLTHYINLSNTNGWKHYVHKRLQSMAKAHPALYGDFPELVSQGTANLPAPSASPTAPDNPIPPG